ncbi:MULTISPECIES: helix-turn-helix domain-containing protein [Sphingobacterium]|uniref:AraC-like DNA-binding protein n=1 Tax=Sphingobacterium siyangense TaxID=459529 RepID=A0A562MK17_9SPHI|nr:MULTISPECIES: AraC family transcriptional regulator [Sphingobacterium]TWI20259.1 AraC-like DNA-binding protein [Sphingobacterium siyangense]
MMNLSFESQKIKHKQKLELNKTGFDFALVYISEGTLVSKGNNLKFSKENLLFLNKDFETLETKKDTIAFVLYFSNSYFKDLHLIQQNFRLSHNPVDIFNSKTLFNKSLSLKKENKKLIERVISLIQQYEREDTAESIFIFHQTMSLFALVENILKDLELPINESYEMSQEIEQYIQQNIYFPDKLQIRSIADQFQISANYFGAFFKKRYSKSYKVYIDDIRIKLVEERLASNRYTMKQIVEELGFNDESHLTNFYKKKRNITPSSYKRAKNSA